MQYTRKDITPITEPVTIDMCVESLYLPDSPDTTLLNMYITAARRYVENYIGCSLVPQEITVVYDSFSTKLMYPIYTENNISVTYLDNDNETQTIDGSDIFCNRHATPAYIEHKTGWPEGKMVKVCYNSTPSNDLEVLKPMMLLIIGHLYENRQIVDTKMTSIHYLLAPFKKSYHP